MNSVKAFRILRDQSGASLLLALGTSAALLIVTFFMSDQLMMMKKQVNVNAEAPQKRLVLHSALDYVIFALKQKWCFSDAMLPDRTCSLSHKYSLERMIISPEQELFLKDLEAKGLLNEPLPSEGLRMKFMEMTVPLTSMTQSHPLFKIIQKVIETEREESEKVTGIKFSLTKEDNVALPQSGRETYLIIKVELLKSGGGILMFGSSPIEAQTLVSVHPREVGSFALVVARNLYLNNAPIEAQGDVSIPYVPTSNAMAGAKGLIFDSPVFINRDIHLPDGTGAEGEVYSPVTFADRVYLGDGRVYQNKLPFVPYSAGGLKSTYWSDHKQFGGFLKGIENDGARDGGLDYLANPTGGVSVDTSLMEKCIERNLTKSDPTYIQGSELVSSVRASTATSATYRLGFSDGNEFSEQENPLEPVNDDDWRGWVNRITPDWDHRKPVALIEVTVGSRKVIAQMSRDTEIDLQVDLGAQAGYYDAISQISSLRSQINNLKNQISSSDGTRSDLLRKISDAEARVADEQRDVDREMEDVAREQEDLDRELAKEPQDQDDIERQRRDVNREMEDVRRERDDVKKEQDKLDVAKANLAAHDAANTSNNYAGQITTLEAQLAQKIVLRDKLKIAVDFPPKLEIDTEEVARPGRRQEDFGSGGGGHHGERIQPHLLDFTMKIQNTSSFINRNGEVRVPTVRVLAYDPTFFRSAPISNENPSLTRFFNFQESGGVISLPSGLSNTSTGSVVVAAPSTAPAVDIGELDELCDTAAVATSSSAFGGANWDYSFAANARHSWNFAGDGTEKTNPSPQPIIPTLTFDATNARRGVAKFEVRSIVGNCIVKPGAEFIAGFLTCDRLVIEGTRTRPLRIIGSVIAMSVTIHPSAFSRDTGIHWSTIYHPQATQELRSAGILESFSGRACDSGQSPFWHPIPAIADVADRFSCNAVSLRTKANPFQWTAVDPDCGYVPGNPTQTCKNRLIRFFVVEHNREAGI